MTKKSPEKPTVEEATTSGKVIFRNPHDKTLLSEDFLAASNLELPGLERHKKYHNLAAHLHFHPDPMFGEYPNITILNFMRKEKPNPAFIGQFLGNGKAAQERVNHHFPDRTTLLSHALETKNSMIIGVILGKGAEPTKAQQKVIDEIMQEESQHHHSLHEKRDRGVVRDHREAHSSAAREAHQRHRTRDHSRDRK